MLFVKPEGYFSLNEQERTRLVRAISEMNTRLKDDTYICVGPGRWGTSTPDLGVGISYGDIYHTRALVELTGKDIGPDLEPSFGTHFFQDLMEAHIHPLAITLGESKTVFNREFFYDTPNHLPENLQADEALANSLHVIRVEDFRPGHTLNLAAFGSLFHLIGAVSQYGKLGMMAVGNSHAEADELYQRTIAVLDEETRDGTPH